MSFKQSRWNTYSAAISERLRDQNELQVIQDTNAMIYHEPTNSTGLIMDVWCVAPVAGDPSTAEEDRYIRYTTNQEIKEDFSVDLDEEGWIWFDELEETK